MSLNKIKAVFEAFGGCSDWSLQLLQIKNSKRTGMSYLGRIIEFSQYGRLTSFMEEIAAGYIGGNKSLINAFPNGVMEYDGSTMEGTIYKLSCDNELIANEYQLLVRALATPDAELNPLELVAKAYVAQGRISLDGEEKQAKLISMRSPITTLKNKYLWSKGKFKEISNKVISLRTTIDVIIIDRTVYLLTLEGENLFNIERAYKATCRRKLEEIKKYDIVSSFSEFSNVAQKGYNPRRFIAFNGERLKMLENRENRKKIAEKFKIPMVEERFETSRSDVSEKLVKLLCNRGMVDPFDDSPVEVVGSRKWE